MIGHQWARHVQASSNPVTEQPTAAILMERTQAIPSGAGLPPLESGSAQDRSRVLRSRPVRAIIHAMYAAARQMMPRFRGC